ncbi:hypothetical protein BOTBODRAFT_38768 [Botryobasidium botryosum FD-172 SS1]|uniref:Retrovirus-related Pol polyprotein from transposon TNT 1-94-like beta-barrel domain-containing protein n=1 Tax=Botryobasidium botryosum (strain FD-172 SS1) TaxID=930990 RepID=A0A067LWB1_BOTB1|nr:hypothetical protein BOTBODRAFT_38768 [Botryobasidium botryosum FD-172 SS1]
MPSNTYLPDSLPLPALSADGSNWFTYNIRMTLFFRAKGLMQPIQLTVRGSPGSSGGLILSNNTPVNPSDWNQRQDAAKFIIASTIPDSLLLLIHHLPTAKEMWDTLAKECGRNLDKFKHGLEKTLQDAHYIIWVGATRSHSEEHFAAMAELREKLAGAGGRIDHTTYRDILIKSTSNHLPGLSTFAGSLDDGNTASSHLDYAGAVGPIAAACASRATQEQDAAGAPIPGDHAGPLQATQALEGRLQTPQVDLTQPRPRARADEAGDLDEPRLPGGPAPQEGNAPIPSSIPSPSQRNAEDRSEVYSIAAPHHISPYHDDFVTFTPIEPKLFRTALGSTLIATGIGDLVASIPSGDDEKPILLKDTYYAHTLSSTLISLPQLSREPEGDLTMRIEDNVLAAEREGETLARIPRRSGLYQVSRHISPDTMALSKTMATDFFPV